MAKTYEQTIFNKEAFFKGFESKFGSRILETINRLHKDSLGSNMRTIEVNQSRSDNDQLPLIDIPYAYAVMARENGFQLIDARVYIELSKAKKAKLDKHYTYYGTLAVSERSEDNEKDTTRD